MATTNITHCVHVEFHSGGGYSHPRRFASDAAAQAWAAEELDTNGGRIRSLEVTQRALYKHELERRDDGSIVGHVGRVPRLMCDREVVYRWDQYNDRCARAACGLVAAMARL